MMLTTISFLFLSTMLTHLLSEVSGLAETIEVCNRETKLINCDRGSVVFIDAARHGRMKRGRCLAASSVDEQFNCSADVRLYLEHRCAGRRQCNVSQDATLDASPHGCNPDRITYIELTYHCQPVHSPSISSADCQSHRYAIPPATSSVGYLARIVTVETGVGSKDCSWAIDVQSGQTIRLTLLDFGIWQSQEEQQRRNQSTESRPTCTVYGTIDDPTISGRSSPICRGEKSGDRERILHTSNGHSVQVTGISKNPSFEYFVIKYEVLGCADINPPPPYASVERKGDQLLMRCILAGKEEQEEAATGGQQLESNLTCIGGNWTDPAQVNCTALYLSASANKKRISRSAMGDVLLTVVVSAAVIIVALVTTVVIFLFCSQRVMKRRAAAIAEMPLSDERRFLPAASSAYDQTQPWPLYHGTTTTTLPILVDPSSSSSHGIRLLYDHDHSGHSPRRPSVEFLDRDFAAATLQMRQRAPNLGHSSSFSSFRQIPDGCESPYDGNTLLMYCPYHGTITRVTGPAQPDHGRKRFQTSYSQENLTCAENQSQQQSIYHELDYEHQSTTPTSHS